VHARVTASDGHSESDVSSQRHAVHDAAAAAAAAAAGADIETRTPTPTLRDNSPQIGLVKNLSSH